MKGYSDVKVQATSLKVVSATFLLVCFFYKRALVKLGKIFFISLQKLFSFSRKSNFRFLDIQTL